ncbi:golvesin C-terminal-like domain-containing protein [Streptomyces sp. LZ34]
MLGLLPQISWADSGTSKPTPLPWESADAEKKRRPSANGQELPSVAKDKRDSILGQDWRNSGDLAWTTSSDADGFHILVSRKREGYTWRTAATLSEPGFDADMWIGNACVTGSGRRAAVVYAPRTFTNKTKLMARGGFTAVLDLNTGKITKLNLNASLSYYSPGCGTGEIAVFTQSAGEDKRSTRLIEVDTVTGKSRAPVETPGQVTSAVAASDGSLVGALGSRVVSLDKHGKSTTIAETDGVPYRLTPDKDGGLVFLDKRGDDTQVKRLPAVSAKSTSRPQVLAAGPVTETGLTHSTGSVYVTGEARRTAAKLPGPVKVLANTSKDATVSTTGDAVLSPAFWADGKGAVKQPQDAATARPVKVGMTVMRTGEKTTFTIDPARAQGAHAAEGRDASPKLQLRPPASGSKKGAKARTKAGGSQTDPVEDERTCSVPRNDPRNQAMQPKPRQIEWAVDQAINGRLDKHISRPANWKNLGMPAYKPQTLFPPVSLEGGGRVPAQVLLGVTTQESNMWQAARVAVPGVTSNPLIGNYYGIDLYDGSPANDWDVNFAEADCGYGVTQVTDHMRMAGRENGHGGAAWDYQKQRAVALDYTANIAAGLQILAGKWNETRAAGMQINDGTPTKMENWFYALWAYNSGFHAKSGSAPWGLGWANNPANPEWDAGRLPFLENSAGGEDPSAAARPQNWPYPEKVIGFAAHPPSFLESPGTMVIAFRFAGWNGAEGGVNVKGSALYNRAHAKPPESLFCDTSNECKPGLISDGASNDSATSGPCQRSDFKCWFNKSATWKTDCSLTCGNEVVRFNETYPEEADGTAYPPACTRTGLPSDALIIDEAPQDTPVIRPGCTNSWTNSGTFSFNFSNNGVETVYPAKVDTHQLGAGFGGHFYFAHTRADDAKGNRLKVTATWKLSKEVNGAARIWVHLPDHGAHTKYARYRVKTIKGERIRTVNQKGNGNRWVDIGAFGFDGKPEVSLDTVTPDGTGDQDIAFDAVAVQPVPGFYMDDSVEAVAFFDERQDIDTDPLSTGPLDTPFKTMESIYDWGMDTSNGVLNEPTCLDMPASNCVMHDVTESTKAWQDQVVKAGKSPTDHPTGQGMTNWLNYANTYENRPTSDRMPAEFLTNDAAYKIRNRINVSYLVDNRGIIIDGTEWTEYEDRTADTHLPKFVMDTFAAVQDAYDINRPDLNYTTADLNEHDGRNTTTDTNSTGVLPGRAYQSIGKRPLITDPYGKADTENGNCLTTLHTAGGSIGYRPMLADDGIQKEFDRWFAEADSAKGLLNESVYKLMREIYHAWFKGGITGSLQNEAPPIWQELSVMFCSDGSVFGLPDRPMLRSSFMPSQYLYHAGAAMDGDGQPTESAEPFSKGDFKNFSRVPGFGETPYGDCSTDSGHSGNPWGIFVTDSPGVNPKAHFCISNALEPDPEYSD